ncbi:hypothetical protein MOOTH_26960 [Moorella thermoacetica]|nr:hypothetical protein MOOTH_26960 [Moorella thermoacetica]
MRRNRAGITNCPFAEIFTIGIAISHLCFTVIIIVKHPLKRYNISLKGKNSVAAASQVSCFRSGKIEDFFNRHGKNLGNTVRQH